MPSRFYRPELDVLRFAAFLAVFFHHVLLPRTPLEATVQETGGFGMCLFFFLSAFLITELLVRERERSGTIHIGAFYVRRILRIWPLYFGFLLFGIGFGHFVPAERIHFDLILSFVLLSGNWYVATHGFPLTPVALLWSISLEEQFYLCWPWMNRLTSRRGAALVCVVVALLGAGVTYGLAWSGVDPAVGIWVNSLVQFQFFGFGGLLAFALHRREWRPDGVVRLLTLAGGALCWLLAEAAFQPFARHDPQQSWQFVLAYWLVGAGCACLIAGLLGAPAKLMPAPLIYLGRISYGLYVFHGVCAMRCAIWLQRWEVHDSRVAAHHVLFAFGKDLVAFGFTVFVASISYRYFESPFLRLKERFTFVPSRAV